MRMSLAVAAVLALLVAACGDAGETAAPATTAAVTTAPAAGAGDTTAPTTTAVETTTTDTATTDTTTTDATTTDTADTAATTTTGETGATTLPDRTDRTTPDTSRVPETVPPDALQPPPAVIGEVPGELLAPVLADAAARTGLEATAIVVVRAQAVEWNDGSLGCAEPGQVYTQATVPGYWVVLDAAGEQLDYRLNDRGFFMLCESPLATGPGGAPSS